MSMSFDTDNLSLLLPHYLSSGSQDLLFKDIDAIQNGEQKEFVLEVEHDAFLDKMLQGDGWSAIPMFEDHSGEAISARGLVLSNSCDIDPDNKRAMSPRFVYAPMMKLEALRTTLAANGLSDASIDGRVAAIKRQHTSTMFFVPAAHHIADDWVVLLDHVHSFDIGAFRKLDEPTKMFTLSNTGLYMFLLKLAYHFCRMEERIDRDGGKEL